MHRVLIVAPHFAPVAAPDGHRARLLAPYLREHGWEPAILSVRADRVLAPREEALLTTLPAGLQVNRTDAIDPVKARRLGVGNLAWRSLPWLWREGGRLLEQGRFDLVYFSTTQFACVPLGRWWRQRFGIPYIVDLQDPWFNDYYDRPGAAPPPGGWKYRFARGFAAALEGATLKCCSHVVSVSPDYPTTLARRYPWFDLERTTVLPFGWSKHDLDAAQAYARIPAAATIRHLGRVIDAMNTCLNAIMRTFADWRSSVGATLSPPQWEFIGTSYAANDATTGVATACARAAGIQHYVTESPDRIGYLEALGRQGSASANLILGSDDLGYSPSKLWPTLACGRPWLAVVPRESVLAEMLRPHATHGLVVTVGSEGICPDDIQRTRRWFDRLAKGELGAPARSSALNDYAAPELARRHAEIFDAVLRA